MDRSVQCGRQKNATVAHDTETAVYTTVQRASRSPRFACTSPIACCGCLCLSVCPSASLLAMPSTLAVPDAPQALRPHVCGRMSYSPAIPLQWRVDEAPTPPTPPHPSCRSHSWDCGPESLPSMVSLSPPSPPSLLPRKNLMHAHTAIALHLLGIANLVPAVRWPPPPPPHW